MLYVKANRDYKYTFSVLINNQLMTDNKWNTLIFYKISSLIYHKVDAVTSQINVTIIFI